MITVSAEVVIAAEPTDVAAVMFDPHRDREWIDAVQRVDVLDSGIKPGARVRRTVVVIGREIDFTTSVAAFQFPHLLELQVVDGPVTGAILYEVGRSPGGSVARIRTTADASPFGPLPDGLVTGPAQAALEAALARLKAVVEAAG